MESPGSHGAGCTCGMGTTGAGFALQCTPKSRACLPTPRLLQPHAPPKGKSFLFRISDFAIDLLGNKSMPMSLKGQADQKNKRQVDVEGFFLPFLLQF